MAIRSSVSANQKEVLTAVNAGKQEVMRFEQDMSSMWRNEQDMMTKAEDAEIRSHQYDVAQMTKQAGGFEKVIATQEQSQQLTIAGLILAMVALI